MIYLAYFALAAAVVVLSTKISYYIDQIDKKTSISSAFIGGVVLAAVTSLPEMFTTISSVVLVGKPDLVIGNILGSNIFNLMVLALVFMLFYKINKKYKISNSHKTTLIATLITYVCLLVVAYFNFDPRVLDVSFVSIIIFVVYVISIKAMSSDEDTASGDGEESPLPLNAIVTRFAALSVMLVLASIAITYASDYIGTELGLGSTVAGAILLGVATSLPEVISCFALAKLGNFNAMVGNIVGSNMFNFAILLLADLLHIGGTIYNIGIESTLLIIFGFASAVVACFILFIVKNKVELTPLAFKFICLMPVFFYISFLVLA